MSLAEKLPEKIGVYIFKGEKSTVYVGKSANIKKRVLHHLQAAKKDEREKKIIDSTKKIDYIVTNTETEALIEENILIKTYKPRYNVRLSDDKSYPYLKINLDNDFPQISITRNIRQKNAKYFGPYCDVRDLRNSLKVIRKIFPFRTCRKDLSKSRMRPCLYYHIAQCSAPCGDKISERDYRLLIKDLITFLEGKCSEVIHTLQNEMSYAASKQDYEKAATLRDQINVLEKIMKESKVVLPIDTFLDAIALVRGKNSVCVQVIQVREGKILSSECFQLKYASDVGDQESLESFIKQYYLKRTYIPNSLYINKKIDDSKTISRWLSEKTGKNVVIKKPLHKKYINIIDIALENAKTHLEQFESERMKALNSLQKLKEVLNLDRIPQMIECFDISNLGQKESVGSKVSFRDGRPDRKQYRMYKIKKIFHQDDQAMIGEIVERRFKRLLKEENIFPDLVVVDGGIAQLQAAKKKMDALNIKIPIIGLAKKQEQIYLQNGDILNLNTRSQPSLILQQIRDEAHRFALQYHRKRRDKF